MNKKNIVLGAAAFLALIYVIGGFGYRTDCIQLENRMDAQYEQNKNNYDNYWKMLKEKGQVKDAFADDLEKVYKGALAGRYGANGSQAVLQFIKEQNPNLDPSVYKDIMVAIEAGRKSFEADQKQLLSIKNEYKNLLGSTRALFYNWFLGFPRCDMSKYGIVTSAATDQAFQTKQAEEIDIFGKKK